MSDEDIEFIVGMSVIVLGYIAGVCLVGFLLT